MMTHNTNTFCTDKQTAPLVTWREGAETLKNVVCAMGVFDGVHQGHHYLIERMLADARKQDLPAWIITFDRDPAEVLRPEESSRKLLSNTDRLQLLAQTGVQGVLVIPFTPQFASLLPDEFCTKVLKPLASISSLHVGVGFRYGTRAQGTTRTLAEWFNSQGGKLHTHKLFDEGGEPITSTRIRGLIEQGDVGKAAQLLARPFYLKGTVVEGRKVGRSFGVPTANLSIGYPAVNLGDGVYGGYAEFLGARYRVATSVGAPTTFAIKESTIEPHLLDFDGDLYGEELRVSFVKHLRPMKTFDSADELKSAIMEDINWIRTNITV